MPYRDKNSPNWFINTYPQGKRVRATSGTTSFEEAKALEAKHRLERHRVKRWGEKEKHPYDDLMSWYLQDTAGKKSHDRDLTSATALQKHFTGTCVEDWTPDFIGEYKTARRFVITARGTRVSDATIGKELNLVSAAIKRANKERGWDLPNVLRGRIPNPKAGKVRWLRREEAAELLRCARANRRSAHLVDFIELGLSTGMRRDEMLELEWSRVDFGQRLILSRPREPEGRRVQLDPAQ